MTIMNRHFNRENENCIFVWNKKLLIRERNEEINDDFDGCSDSWNGCVI